MSGIHEIIRESTPDQDRIPKPRKGKWRNRYHAVHDTICNTCGCLIMGGASFVHCVAHPTRDIALTRADEETAPCPDCGRVHLELVETFQENPDEAA